MIIVDAVFIVSILINEIDSYGHMLITVFMTRPKCCRKISSFPAVREYQPSGEQSPETPSVSLSLDELEAVRLADYETMYQEDAALKMGISRQTFGRIISAARGKIADAILNGKRIEIGGGTVTIRKRGLRTCDHCDQSEQIQCTKREKGNCPRCAQ